MCSSQLAFSFSSESSLQRQQIRSLLRRSYCHRTLRRSSCACTSGTRPSLKGPPEHGRSWVMGRYLVQKLHHARAEGSEEARRTANLRQPQHQVTCRVCRPAVQLPERCAPKFSNHYYTLFLPRCICRSCSKRLPQSHPLLDSPDPSKTYLPWVQPSVICTAPRQPGPYKLEH